MLMNVYMIARPYRSPVPLCAGHALSETLKDFLYEALVFEY